MAFELPDLPYAHDALEPHMSAETLEFHHDKHHQAYVTNGNNLAKEAGVDGQPLAKIVKESHGKNAGLFNNAAQHYNHLHFWQWMKPDGGGKAPGALAAKIDSDLGGFDKFRADFINAGMTQFGSGWCWLAMNASGKLEVVKTPNGENPLVNGSTPLLGCDVWEHSYYIDYRNLRPKYLETWFDNLVNWQHVADLLEDAS